MSAIEFPEPLTDKGALEEGGAFAPRFDDANNVAPRLGVVWALGALLGLRRVRIGPYTQTEPFLTARPIAESIGLLAIGLLGRRRLPLAFGALVLAALLHPLQALAVALVAAGCRDEAPADACVAYNLTYTWGPL